MSSGAVIVVAETGMEMEMVRWRKIFKMMNNNNNKEEGRQVSNEGWNVSHKFMWRWRSLVVF